MLRFIGALVVCLVVITGVALWMGWIQFGVVNRDRDTQVNLTVDRDKVKESLAHLPGQKSGQEMRGTVQAIDGDKATIQTGQTSLTAFLTQSTKITQGNKEVGRAALRPGMEIRLTYVTEENRNVASQINIESQ
jgi:hypothetical protein